MQFLYSLWRGDGFLFLTFGSTYIYIYTVFEKKSIYVYFCFIQARNYVYTYSNIHNLSHLAVWWAGTRDRSNLHVFHTLLQSEISYIYNSICVNLFPRLYISLARNSLSGTFGVPRQPFIFIVDFTQLNFKNKE